MNVLIVDDEIEILHMLRRNLELEGFQVTTASDPFQAVDLMKQELFNLVLLDIRMPGMTGVQLLQELKRINPLTNVIIMTGYSSMANVVDCLGAGAVDYFVKPFMDLNLLIDSLEQARSRLERWRTAMDLGG